jgi:geranylgeranyl diphosphate synthase type I
MNSVDRHPKLFGTQGQSAIDLSLEAVDAIMRTALLESLDRQSPLHQAISYHMSSGGKKTRAKVALDAGALLSVDSNSVLAIAGCCELLHNASLIHDDIQDQDILRRGRPSVWQKYGRDCAICVGDLFISAAYGVLSAIPSPNHVAELLRQTHAAVTITTAGQASDMAAKLRPLTNMTDYETIVAQKSGQLLELPLKSVLIIAGHQKALETLAQGVRSIAVAYQLLDDLEDAEVDEQLGALNGVNVIRQAGISLHPQAHARSLAETHLDNAIHQFKQLPHPSGMAFSPVIGRLRKGLSLEGAHAHP